MTIQTPAAFRVLVTSRSFSTGSLDIARELRRDGIAVVTGPPDHDLTALAPLLADVDGWIAGTGPVTDSHFAVAPRLRIVARYGVGVDAVDLAAARNRGIIVTNTPGANSGAVADHALALILSALRGVAAGDRRVRAGTWTVQRARELGGLTVGVIGFGRIGRGVAERLRGFGCRALASDPYLADTDIRAAGAEPVSPAALAARSDVISLHAPGDQLIVDADWLTTVRAGLILVNTARADLVDEQALAQALRDGRVGAYAADTLSTESTHAAGDASPLLAGDLADRVTLTPHSAAQTVEAVDRMGAGTAEAVRAVLHDRDPDPALVGIVLPRAMLPA